MSNLGDAINTMTWNQQVLLLLVLFPLQIVNSESSDECFVSHEAHLDRLARLTCQTPVALQWVAELSVRQKSKDTHLLFSI